uniref:Uncharacterized protein n=1 Tax=virus sp. ctK6s94 TaxID=2826798 RepID=A0A8S5MF94_9VIRU|nr:MAG TPA: hypothetical protein [virus sp. ctK6s94]
MIMVQVFPLYQPHHFLHFPNAKAVRKDRLFPLYKAIKTERGTLTPMICTKRNTGRNFGIVDDHRTQDLQMLCRLTDARRAG